ncbi:hypothetical protein FHS96_004980 [Sphingomonas zeicaulis]|uniref:Bbp19 family protein n=1 Tax=Sphingomonas zeicaulis TaxID=1632740 RepID=UPI003D1A3052
MRLDEEAAAIVRAARTRVSQVRARIAALFRRHRVYQRLFVGADGELTEDAVRFLDELAHACGGDVTSFRADPYEHARMAGRREVYLHILGGLRLDQRRLAALTRELREEDDE